MNLPTSQWWLTNDRGHQIDGTRMRITKSMLLALLVFLSACAHTYSQPTGLPADVHDRFSFHMNVEAQERGLRTARSDTGVTVYAPEGRITYSISADEIVAVYTIPNKSGKNDNYYASKRNALDRLSKELIDGARKRAQDARDFAY